MEGKRKSFTKGILVGAIVSFAVMAAYFGAASERSPLRKGQSYFFAEPALSKPADKKLKTIQGLIDKLYLYSGDIDQNDLKEGIYKGYVSALGDPYSAYFDKEETTKLFESTSGKYSGVGAVLSQNIRTRTVIVNSVYEGSPAQKGGLLSGDRIYKVDDHVLAGEDLSEIVSWIRGLKGTEVTLHVYRGENEKKEDCRITRDVIEAQTVSEKMMEDGIGYLRIAEFDEVTFGQFQQALTNLEGKGMKALVIDLRSNPGGNLDTTVKMLRLILPKGLIVYTQSRDGKREEYRNKQDHRFNKPMAVLVDEYTASAAEIFSGAVKDYGVATIVGTTTFGKGIVQQIVPLGDGTSLKLTVSQYFTPSGENIHKKGIKPDEMVKISEDASLPQSDIQLERAVKILKGKLS